MESIYESVGHSSNLVGLPTDFLASCDFNDQPMPVHISGAREMNDNLFKMLQLAADLNEAGQAFNSYMYAMFGLDPEQRDLKTRGQTAQRRYRSSFLQLIKGWGIDSNGPEGAVLKGWVESRFGIFPTYHKELISRISSGPWTTYVVEKMSSQFHNNAIYTQLDLLYEYCQWALEYMVAPGQTHLTLYRGVNAFDEHYIKDRADKDHVVMRLNNLASFSSDRDVASCFGDIILTVAVPLAKLVFFNTLLPMHGLKGEAEYLVIGGDYRVAASHL
jgi:NAD+--dinitrogen-reductase ADP-D-ribosyltransferase